MTTSVESGMHCASKDRAMFSLRFQTSMSSAGLKPGWAGVVAGAVGPCEVGGVGVDRALPLVGVAVVEVAAPLVAVTCVVSITNALSTYKYPP